jgi:hypothetical protein
LKLAAGPFESLPEEPGEGVEERGAVAAGLAVVVVVGRLVVVVAVGVVTVAAVEVGLGTAATVVVVVLVVPPPPPQAARPTAGSAAASKRVCLKARLIGCEEAHPSASSSAPRPYAAWGSFNLASRSRGVSSWPLSKLRLVVLDLRLDLRRTVAHLAAPPR